MKLLVDKCVARAVSQRLRDDGHDVSTVAEWPSDPGDKAILERAADEGRSIITIDADFGALVFRDHARRVGVLRLREQPPGEQAKKAREIIAIQAEALSLGAFVTDDGETVRVNLPDA